MSDDLPTVDSIPRYPTLRLETLVKIRWVAIAGQAAAVLVVWLVLGFHFYPQLCLILVGVSALLNIYLNYKFPANTRLPERASVLLLVFDAIQLAVLLFLTGGLENPFAILIIVPVIISSTTLTTRSTVLLGIVVLCVTTLLVFFHLPLPWITYAGLDMPSIYVWGMWFAIISSLLFTSAYAFRVADEARKLADALAATELVLLREQHLSSLDGLAAAAAHELGTPLATIALVSKEMLRELETGSALEEDAKLLRSQAERCREILSRLTSLSSQQDEHIARIPITGLLDEVSQPHRNFGIEIDVRKPATGNEPKCKRNPAVVYGLGNLVENAVDHAKERVVVETGWDNARIWIMITDDGSGFREDMLSRIGEPYVNNRAGANREGGLGLGLFIAKTLLERSGANLVFNNAIGGSMGGAVVRVEWPRFGLDT